MRGDKIGIAGPNGSGKTTLIRLLLGNIEPDYGSVRLGTNLEILYFDQLRDKLEDNKTVADNVGEGNDKVTVNGKTRHIISYLKDFLFTPDRSSESGFRTIRRENETAFYWQNYLPNHRMSSLWTNPQTILTLKHSNCWKKS